LNAPVFEKASLDAVTAEAIRVYRREDRVPLLRILEKTEVFNSEELAIALELMDAVSDKPGQQDYLIGVYDNGTVAGYYCIGPTPATAGTFDLYWIAVDPSLHGQGVGSALIRHAEQLVVSRGGRLIVVETSSRDRYEPTRRFYAAVGYREIARIRAYYRPDDDLVVFGKYLS
jgi:ribosomal protein S18 acetylase RimI-like enzyme